MELVAEGSWERALPSLPFCTCSSDCTSLIQLTHCPDIHPSFVFWGEVHAILVRYKGWLGSPTHGHLEVAIPKLTRLQDQTIAGDFHFCSPPGPSPAVSELVIKGRVNIWAFCCHLLPHHTAPALSAAERGMQFASPDTLGKRNS